MCSGIASNFHNKKSISFTQQFKHALANQKGSRLLEQVALH